MPCLRVISFLCLPPALAGAPAALVSRPKNLLTSAVLKPFIDLCCCASAGEATASLRCWPLLLMLERAEASSFLCCQTFLLAGAWLGVAWLGEAVLDLFWGPREAADDWPLVHTFFCDMLLLLLLLGGDDFILGFGRSMLTTLADQLSKLI